MFVWRLRFPKNQKNLRTPRTYLHVRLSSFVSEQSGDQTLGLGNTNLADVLRDPENLKNLFSRGGAQGELAIDSLKLLAGPRAGAAVDKLMEEIMNGATDSMGS